MRRSPWRHACGVLALLVPVVAGSVPARAGERKAEVPVQQFTLDNGMKFLLVPRPEQADGDGAAGWRKVGSANERPGITGVAHFFEHMMFKGSRTIGTTDIERDAEIIAEQEQLQERDPRPVRGAARALAARRDRRPVRPGRAAAGAGRARDAASRRWSRSSAS